MKKKYYFFTLILILALIFLNADMLKAASINAIQQNLNSNYITENCGCSSAVQDISASACGTARSLSGCCNQLSGCCNRINSSCSNFFGEFKSAFFSFFQNLFSLFNQIIKQFADAFSGCSGCTNSVNDNFCADDRCNESESDAVLPEAENQSIDSNDESVESGSNASNKADSNGASNTASSAKKNQVSDSETPAGEDSSVNTSDARSLLKAIKDKFNITIENGTSQWSLSQLQQAYQTLSKLPPSFISETNMIQRISTTNLGSNVGGYVSSDAPRVYVTDHGVNSMTFVLVHEMAHCFHFAKRGIFSQWESLFWSGRSGYSGRATQLSPSVSAYGNANSMEDFAESVRVYFMDGPSMKRTHPDRYEFIKNNVMGGVEY